MPKRVKIFTSKWHRKQQHLFIHPFRSLQCIRFVEKKFFCREQAYQSLSCVRKGGDEFSIMPPSGAPWNFDWTKLAHAQLGYGAYNIRPYLGLYGI